ncbi:G patch domain-containing protein 11 isoform X2 [Hyalella azteca]|uniref:G patch domain-containing protein 11 n=1 Tax=Hyalella azteca TaxID=294128 RepID=A0A8B7N987_HYAAZ|nr:G patch domain-containing protein 11 isoform X2 [Hyalella azteca]
MASSSWCAAGQLGCEEDDEEDYMSDNFLAKCTQEMKDIRPGMPMSYAAKRKLEMEKKKKEEIMAARLKKKNQPSARERLEDGLNSALGESNKGFAMLMKMGYKPGTSLGDKGGGCVEPIKVELKGDRGGLGLKQMLMEKKREKEQRYLAKMKKLALEFDPDVFRERKRQENMGKQLEADLARCQRVCFTLDSDNGIEEPMESYFWPPHLLPAHEGQGDDEDDAAEEDDAVLEYWQVEVRVDVVASYLRLSYHYCVWCGTAYEDEADMTDNCPGTTKEEHDS